MKYVIIGAGIAGATAAETIKKKDKNAEVILISDERDLVYNKVLLPNVIKKRTSRKSIFVKTADQLQKLGIAVFSGTRVSSVDARSRKVEMEDGTWGIYDKLLIATGAKPKQWDVPGADLDGVHQFHTLADTDAIIRNLKKTKTAAIAGGGFISLELADAFCHLGIETHLFLRKKGYWLAILDKEQSQRITRKLEAMGVIVHAEEPIKKIVGANRAAAVKTAQAEYSADLVGYGIGLDYQIGFLDGSGIETFCGVSVNEYLQTSDQDVYAAGDVAEFHDCVTDGRNMAANWGNAVKQGEVAARNMLGEHIKFCEVTSYSMTISGLFIAMLGSVDLRQWDSAVVRKNDEQYVKLYTKGGILVGASFVGGVRDMVKIKQAILNKDKADSVI